MDSVNDDDQILEAKLGRIRNKGDKLERGQEDILELWRFGYQNLVVSRKKFLNSNIEMIRRCI